MTEIDQLTVEATGETVGEAKWAALRELELRYPGLDRGAVQFQVLSEGERGLLGVGYAPARVLALVPEGVEAAVEVARANESAQATDVRSLVQRIASAVGAPANVDVREDDSAIHVTCSGHDLGSFIGRHGQTIDAIQYLVNTIAWRAYGDERKEVVLDAAGYRERRRVQLEALAVQSAEQALRTLERVELESMTAIERKIVHLRLADYDGVETASEGAEPHRYVVVVPAR